MQLRIAGTVDDSIVDGPGFRFTVFTQGCPHACVGCHNPETHDPMGGRLVEVDQLLAQIRANPMLDGLTLSGGEPFEQPEACAALALGAKALGLSVWSYTGYRFEALLAKPGAQALLETLDVLVDGPFVLAQRTLELRFRGSKNQRLLDVPRSLAQGCAVEYALGGKP